MKKISLFVGSLIVLGLTGCSTAQVSALPEANNQYQLTATASSSTEALDAAMDKATSICGENDQKPTVVKSKVKYQGMDKGTQQLAQMAAMAITMNSSNFVPGPDTSQNYVANVTIQCQ